MAIGVVGLGGLGHMVVKWAKAFGCTVTVISTSPSKKGEALERLGAHKFVVSRSEEEMKAAAGTLHGIIDTVAGERVPAPAGWLRLDGWIAGMRRGRAGRTCPIAAAITVASSAADPMLSLVRPHVCCP